jgi:hypothetical protein
MGEIIIKIKDGKTHIEVTGVEDASCADITAALEQALGEVEDVQRKPEYYTVLDDLTQEVDEDE